ncbi:hypothetical protein [Acidovorax sp. Root267]|uniref:hypothetical protein n=1 Tax=Acidovorax sp. Root267 TaxID=1736505 RepID=UPI0011251133|nr:hypothetical protein [Acidovorax sp. Root267]
MAGLVCASLCLVQAPATPREENHRAQKCSHGDQAREAHQTSEHWHGSEFAPNGVGYYTSKYANARKCKKVEVKAQMVQIHLGFSSAGKVR